MVQLNLTTEVERMLSRDVAAQVIRELGIDAMPEFNRGRCARSPGSTARRAFVRQILDSGPAEPSGPPIDDMDSVIPAYMAALSVSREPMSDVVRIGFVSEDPELAAEVPNALLQVYLATGRRVWRGTCGAPTNGSTFASPIRRRAWRPRQRRLRPSSKASGLAFGDPLASANQVVATIAAVRAASSGSASS